MQPGDPVAAALAACASVSLRAIAPLLVARLRSSRKLDGALADARQRVADDAALRLELRVVAHVLELAPAAPVDA